MAAELRGVGGVLKLVSWVALICALLWLGVLLVVWVLDVYSHTLSSRG